MGIFRMRNGEVAVQKGYTLVSLSEEVQVFLVVRVVSFVSVSVLVFIVHSPYASFNSFTSGRARFPDTLR